jgi:serine/threonine-protein kinase
MRFGRYLLLNKLAVGGMAEIFRAKTQGAHGFEKMVVVKRILPQLMGDSGGGFIERFIAEAKLMMRLNHPKVVQVLDFGEEAGQLFIAMEYIEGIDGSDLLRTCARVRRRPTTGIAVHIAAEVLDALAFAHSLTDESGVPLGITHRDVSPSNIFISDLGQVKLGDFGIAKVDAWKDYTEPGALKGKYGYLAPEAVAGTFVDHRADLFSVGVVLAELLMIRRLFIADNPLDVLLQVRDVNLDRLDRYGSHIDASLREIMEAALARDAGLRFQDAATFRDALHRYLFERQLMVRDNEVRRFLERLRETDGAQPQQPPTQRHPAASRSTASVISPPPMRPRRNYPSSEQTLDIRPGALNGGPERERAGQNSYRRRRKLTIKPPSKPEPIPTGTRETPRMETCEALAAVTEVENAVDESSAGFRIQLPTPFPDPPSPDQVVPAPPAATVAQSIVDNTPLPSPDFVGDLVGTSAVRVFFDLALNEEQGLLVFRRDHVVKEIYYEDGDPEYVASNLPEELFGQYLLGKRVISEGELAMALAMLERFQGKLGAALVGLKLLKPMEVMRHLTNQVRHKLLDVFGWERGQYAFYRQRVFNQEAAPLGLEGYEIIGAGVGAIPADVLARRIAPHRERRLRSVSPPVVPPEVFRLGARPRQIYDTLDGRHTLLERLTRFDDDEQRDVFARTVYLLVETGLVRA